MFTFYVASSVCPYNILLFAFIMQMFLYKLFLNIFTKHYSSMPQGLLNMKIENRNGMAYHMNLQLVLGTF